METLYIGNDMRARLPGLTDADGNELSGASVEVTLYHASVVDGVVVRGEEVAGANWPIAAADDGGGDYSVILPAEIDVEDRGVYQCSFEVEVNGLTGSFDKTCIARWRS